MLRTGVSGRNGRLFTRALLSVLAIAGAGSAASAQTTVTLDQPTSEVLSATVRGGSYADRNDQWTLETRSSDNLEYERRALLKFDTQHGVPKGAGVTSALMSITVKDGSEDASRRIGAYQTSVSWTENQVTWKLLEDTLGGLLEADLILRTYVKGQPGPAPAGAKKPAAAAPAKAGGAQ